MDIQTRKFLKENRVRIMEIVDLVKPEMEEILKTQGIQAVVNFAHMQVDRLNEKLEDKTTCGGCNFCCYSSIDMTEYEAICITSLINQSGIPFDKELLKRQNKGKYHKLKYADKKCIMLDTEGKCSIYEYRPMICRLWNSTDDPKKCDQSKGDSSSGTVRIVEAWGVAMALMSLNNPEVKTLPLHKVVNGNC